MMIAILQFSMFYAKTVSVFDRAGVYKYLIGQNARKIAENKFNSDDLARQALSVLLDLKKP